MTYANKRVYQIDLTLQRILIIPMGILYCTIILGYFGLMLQFFVGLLQVTSGIFHALYYKDLRRQKYLLVVIAYFSLWFIGSLIIPYQMPGVEIILFIWLIIIPVGIAIWYMKLTKQDMEAAEDSPKRNQVLAWQEDIIDVGFEQ